MQKGKKSKYVVISFVCLVFGFILAFSYSYTSKEKESGQGITDKQHIKEMELRQQLVSYQERNLGLQKKLYEKQDNVRQMEKQLSQEEQTFSDLAEDAEKYRMFLGKIKVEGPGIVVSLEDGDFTTEGNVNDYLVHEHHVFKVINELYISGASAVAVNGQRLKHDSYIVCTGPVITVDGNPFPAPFEITAIGETDVMVSALTLKGGVRDQLVNDNITFTLEKKKLIELEPVLGEAS
ncbi:DUF881 domain-containing protein [Lederbergia lenta]|uniref:YlxW n=1 Tax=Lederbergia lenta TaxID=1467 RepID=A0A2X4W766_LEDLE|nr:DUF881 domain-containing protein [Lederbergia lenta]MEC2324198.1 DUF881 domain-containing protein [Lederbergia lenta]SQI60497.1 YlxW [Lederbergia lenta]